MDIASGTFTAQTGGLYTVTFSGQADLDRDSSIKLVLLHNGLRRKKTMQNVKFLLSKILFQNTPIGCDTF